MQNLHYNNGKDRSLIFSLQHIFNLYYRGGIILMNLNISHLDSLLVESHLWGSIHHLLCIFYFLDKTLY